MLENGRAFVFPEDVDLSGIAAGDRVGIDCAYDHGRSRGHDVTVMH